MTENALQDITILMIEDDPMLLEFYQRLLERDGATLITAPDGEDGLELIKSEEPDLVLLDIMLPRMTGFEFLERLKKSKKEHCPIIVLTDLDQAGVEEKALALGADAFVPKTDSNRAHLRDKIIELLGIENR